MLPFLKRNQDAASSSPVEVIKRDSDEASPEPDHLESAMEELHSALMSKDYKSAAEIFRACQELLDSEPHIEGPHINKE